jgi:hypothetical protein
MQVIIVKQARWEYLLMSGQDGEPVLYRPGQELLYNQGHDLRILDVKTNLWPLSQLTLILAASDGKEIELTNYILDDDFIAEAWAKGNQLSLKWLHAGQLVGHMNVKQKEN